MHRLGLVGLLPLLLVTPALAEGPAIAEIHAVWAACTDTVAANPDGWTGWRRNFDGGYGDSFQFWDLSYDGTSPSVLKQSFLIDAIAYEEQTSCFRPDGTLAFVFTAMTSPNMASGVEGPPITREGRIHVGPDGKALSVVGRIVADGKLVGGPEGDEAHMLARDCWELDLHLTTAKVAEHLASELGDIAGELPGYTPNPFDWCAVAETE